jgi:hypothetical protein
MEFLYEQDNLNILILSLDSPILSSRIAAAEFLLAIVTLEYPKGHGLVIAAFENFRITLNEHRLFEKLLKALYDIVSTRGIFGSVVGSRRDRLTSFLATPQLEKNQEMEQQKEIKDFLVRQFCWQVCILAHPDKISTLALIRYIVEIPDELEYRIYLRNELFASGFRIIIKVG